MDTTAFVVVFIDIVQKCSCIIIYRHICWNVLALSSLEIVFLKLCFIEKKRNKANVAFAIYRGLGIETLLFSREMCSRLVLKNLSFLLTFDFALILLFFPTAFSGPMWQTLRMLAPGKQFVCGVGRSTGSLQSHTDIMYKRFSHWFLFFCPQN